MLPSRLELRIVTPERLIVNETVDEVVLPSVEGYLGARPGHAPLLAQLDIGQITYRVGDRQHALAVAGGFAEVLRGSVQVLAESCEPAGEIDVERARADKARAEAELAGGAREADVERLVLQLKKAENRLAVHRQASG